MNKIYCYVDESGQDTIGELFIVTAVIAANERDELTKKLEQIERQTGKGNIKWAKASRKHRLDYMRIVCHTPAFIGRLYYAHYSDTLEYTKSTIEATAQAILLHVQEEKYKASVLVDGLHNEERKTFAVGLRERGVSTDKVRGVTDESEAIIRLADAVAGFTRDGLEQSDLKRLVNQATRDGYLIRLDRE